MFENRNTNNLFGLFTGNVCQGFSVSWWKSKHCAHHSVPNVALADPDINTLPFLAWSEHALEGFSDIDDHKLASFLVSNQAVMYFPLLSLARLSWALQSIFFVKEIDTKNHVISGKFLFAERLGLAIHWFCYLSLVGFLAWTNPLYSFVYFFLSQTVSGVLLAVVFSLNHVKKFGFSHLPLQYRMECQ